MPLIEEGRTDHALACQSLHVVNATQVLKMEDVHGRKGDCALQTGRVTDWGDDSCTISLMHNWWMGPRNELSSTDETKNAGRRTTSEKERCRPRNHLGRKVDLDGFLRSLLSCIATRLQHHLEPETGMGKKRKDITTGPVLHRDLHPNVKNTIFHHKCFFSSQKMSTLCGVSFPCQQAHHCRFLHTLLPKRS